MPFAANTTCLRGRYTLLAKLGAGGQSEVWRARDHERGEEIALKILNAEAARSPGAWEALEREHAVVSRLSHPLILKVFPPGRDDEEGVLVLPMELAAGGDLKRLRGVSYLEIGPILLELAEALSHAHALGIVHRDLKPENVLFDARGHVRLADFGIAGPVPGSDSNSREPARAGGSPFSASPEQLRGEPPAVSDDIYGLGALAYELLSGHPPYFPRFDLERMLEEPVPPLKPAHQTPERLIALVTSMLARSASERPTSMGEVIDALDATLNDTLILEQEGLAALKPRIRPSIGVGTGARAGASASATTWLPSGRPRTPPGVWPVRARSGTVTAPGSRRSAPPPPGNRPAAARSEEPIPASARLPDSWLRAVELRSGRAPEVERPNQADLLTGGEPYPDPPELAASAARAADADDPGAQGPAIAGDDLRSLWADIRVERMPSLMRLEPERHSRWPWVLLVAMVAAVVGIFLWFPPGGAHSVTAQHWPSSPEVRGVVKSITDTARRIVSSVTSPPHARATPGGSNATNAAGDATPAAGEPGAASANPEGRIGSPQSIGSAPGVAAANIPVGGTPASGANGAAAPAAPPPAPNLEPRRSGRSRGGRHQPHASRSPGALGAAGTDGENAARTHLDARLATLDARGASIWGGADYAEAREREAEALSAARAGDLATARGAIIQANRLLDGVEQAAPHALAAQLSAGERALEAGNRTAAQRAFELADRIDPGDLNAEQGLQSARVLNGVLPLVSDGFNAERARDYSRAAQDYGQVLALDPGNVKARAGLKRVNLAWGGGSDAEALSAGFTALGAGHLDDAHAAFTRALRIDGRSREALAGIALVNAALQSRGLAQLRSRAATLESQERWAEALRDYDAALRLDPSLVFARQGKERAAARLNLTSRLEGLVDNPQRLASADARADALGLIGQANTEPSGVVLRSLAARLSVLLSQYDKTVHLELESDNETQIEIQQIGSFGTFARREIDLKPGRYTVIGTRAGYRAVRRDVTVAPGQKVQTLSVRCEEPI